MFTVQPTSTAGAASSESHAYEMERAAAQAKPTRPSRYMRPVRPAAGLLLQERDRAILGALRTYRYLKSRHVHQLLFADVSLRAAQVRLRKLWEHQYLDRHYVPFLLDGHYPLPQGAGEPIYALAPRGAEHLMDEGEGGAGGTVGRPEFVSPITLSHHLVAVDFLVSLAIAAREWEDRFRVSVEPEWMLWRQVMALKENGRLRPGYLVSDGAFTLYLPSGEQMSFHLEVVRAGVKGGNQTLLKKLRRYTALHREGYFERVFGHQHLRAILILTTSAQRAEHFRHLAAHLPHGRRLFWFGIYLDHDEQGREVSTLTPASIFAHRWMNTAGEQLSLVLPGVGRAPHPPAAT